LTTDGRRDSPARTSKRPGGRKERRKRSADLGTCSELRYKAGGRRQRVIRLAVHAQNLEPLTGNGRSAENLFSIHRGWLAGGELDTATIRGKCEDDGITS